MAERRRKLTRTEQRADIRKGMARNVKPWPMALEMNVARITQLAEDEWNFEKFYDQVRRFAGGTVTREMLQEFMRAKQIKIKSRPKGGGRPV